MKKILIPTDFSPVADNALNHAIEIASKFKSELFLYHFYSFNKKALAKCAVILSELLLLLFF